MSSHNLRLERDLEILVDMYPELQTLQENKTLTGTLPFNIQSGQEDVRVTYNNEPDVKLEKLPNNVLKFKICPLEKYPNLLNGISLELESPWMGEEDKSEILHAIRHEFGHLTDPSNESFDIDTPLLMLIFGFLLNDCGCLLFPNNERKCQTKEEYDNYKELLNVLDEEERSKTNFHCCICMETQKGDKMIKFPCSSKSHFLCVACTKNYYTTMIDEGRITNVRCPECKFDDLDLSNFQSFSQLKRALFTPAIPFDFFDGILTDEVCKRYEALFFAQNATKLSKYSPYACTTCPRCGKWCIKNDLDDVLMNCTQCDFTFCFDCLHSWHGYNNACGRKVLIASETLEEYLDKELTDQRKKELEIQFGKRILELASSEYTADKLLELAIQEEGSDLQRCPNCRLVVQRSEGCNRMKCEVCGSLFCYLCGLSLYVDDCYEHFRNLRSPCYGKLFEGMPGTQDA
ncbi:RBR-type E3 ubiquitin transferase KNAG_0E04030 [Huiozyma naganishii CBS 8797]|uniref:RBR-type E3 ubiquitin transferase n=1 Tax=Huiozyma naganishii (strain ATCC MYA-139 / BCRC 22969 / CBS 8797 / KCTC 17520 / NBRC 10181 / NCYC 3082 / Yp74L-3) TaxID=1071383 RepID=J7S829_HUIN7|nr:hypothetical protein KNAG_0E04030 [Kazachstania naganishii CBS 8797]CCK70656.1 hypothetical protein KNAG_0E04030 [Kazachstania naganishii CBS 8797]